MPTTTDFITPRPHGARPHWVGTNLYAPLTAAMRYRHAELAKLIAAHPAPVSAAASTPPAATVPAVPPAVPSGVPAVAPEKDRAEEQDPHAAIDGDEIIARQRAEAMSYRRTPPGGSQ